MQDVRKAGYTQLTLPDHKHIIPICFIVNFIFKIITLQPFQFRDYVGTALSFF